MIRVPPLESLGRPWWYVPLIPLQRWVDLCEIEAKASLDYRAISRIAKLHSKASPVLRVCVVGGGRVAGEERKTDRQTYKARCKL